MLSFKEYLRMLEEDDNTDLANLTIKKQQLIVRKAQQDKPLDDQINQTDKLLMQKEKLAAQNAKKKGTQQNALATATAQGSNRTTTPGSSGAQMPGQSSQSGAPQR